DFGWHCRRVGGVSLHADALRHRAELHRVEDVAGEGRPAADDLVAWVEQREREVHDPAVAPGGDRDVLETDSVALGERRSQHVGAPVRVPVQLWGPARDRLEGLWEGAVLSF